MESTKSESAPSQLLMHIERPISAAVFALWIAICAAAPELMWQGLLIAMAHGGHFDWVSPMLFGLMSVFFIEPLLHHGRGLIEGRHEGAGELQPWSPVYRFFVGFAFGLASMFIHEAFTAYLAGGEGGTHAEAGVKAALEVTVSWALVPFMIALAWQSARNLWIGIPIGIAAAASSAFAGWMFDWTVVETATTAIPCIAIQALGYRWLRTEGGHVDFVRIAPVTAAVALVWLGLATIYDLIADARGSAASSLYNWTNVFIDARFYIGWCLGLLLVPSPPAKESAHALAIDCAGRSDLTLLPACGEKVAEGRMRGSRIT